jgi:hypothetical protein
VSLRRFPRRRGSGARKLGRAIIDAVAGWSSMTREPRSLCAGVDFPGHRERGEGQRWKTGDGIHAATR